MIRPAPPPVLTLDEGGAAMLDLLVDLGHLDDKLLAIVNDRLLDLQTRDSTATADDVRRVAADVIFEHLADADAEYQRALDHEWGLLFY
jgi:hypothetical protein